MTKKYLTIVLLFITLFICKAQTELRVDKKDPFYKVFSKTEYLADLDELARDLTETHPRPYAFTSKEDFWKIVEKQKKKISDSTTFSEFIWLCSPIIASIGCSHTSLGYFSQEDKMLPISLRFPIEAKLIDERLYISDPLINKGKVKPGNEVFSINGIPVEELKGDIYKHIASQAKNNSFKRLLFNGFFTSYIPYSLGFPDKYEILTKGNNKPISLTKLSEYKYKSRINPNAVCQDKLCLNFLKENSTAILTIRSFAFYGSEKFQIYKSFIDNSFKKIKSENTKNLIIDLRMNNGGPADAGIYLLKYLADNSFTYFDQKADGIDYKNPYSPLPMAYEENTYILIDGECTSTTGHFLSVVKQNEMATLIGEEAGSNFICTANQKRGVKLSNTGIKYSVAQNTYFTTAQNFPNDKGILPDHNIVQSIQDYLSNKDTVMNYTIELIINE